MQERTSIKQLIQDMSGNNVPDIVKAVVTKTDPIEMTLVEDRKIVLTEKSLIIPPARLWRLDKDMEYYLLCFNKRHVYYVLDRAKEYGKDG